MIVLTAKDLTPEERNQLNGNVEKVMQKGMSTDLVLSEVRELLTSCLEQKTGKRGRFFAGNRQRIFVNPREARMPVISSRKPARSTLIYFIVTSRNALTSGAHTAIPSRRVPNPQ